MNKAVKKPFRWGGFEHTFDKLAKEWFEQDNIYKQCFCCKEQPPLNEPLYCAIFERNIDDECRFSFKILCRKCAYSYGAGVIESNGKTYFKYEDFLKEVTYNEEK